jgi:hypothetical protein
MQPSRLELALDELLIQRAQLIAIGVTQHHLAHRFLTFLLGVLANRIHHRLGQSGRVTVEQHDRQIVTFMGLKLVALQSHSAARLSDTYRRANIDPKKMSEAMRAAKVALTVDGKRHEAWLARGAAPKTIETTRGPMTVFYGFESIRLPYQLALKEARMTRDPGSANAASYADSDCAE